MPKVFNAYEDPTPGYTGVIEGAIADWERKQIDPQTLPMEERTVGSLALLITRRLVGAGLIDATRITEDM